MRHKLYFYQNKRIDLVDKYERLSEKKAIIYNTTIPCRDQCVQGPHGRYMLYNFQEQTIFLLYAEQQLDQVDCFSDVEVLQK
jgi:hypothetical protein